MSTRRYVGELQDGNRRYVRRRGQEQSGGQQGGATTVTGGPSVEPAVPAHRPLAVVVGCSDARVPPEHVFDQPPGALFVVRVAGHVLEPAALASVLYAVRELGVRLVVVLGHQACGAVRATLAALGEGVVYAPPGPSSGWPAASPGGPSDRTTGPPRAAGATDETDDAFRPLVEPIAARLAGRGVLHPEGGEPRPLEASGVQRAEREVAEMEAIRANALATADEMRRFLQRAAPDLVEQLDVRAALARLDTGVVDWLE